MSCLRGLGAFLMLCLGKVFRFWGRLWTCVYHSGSFIRRGGDIMAGSFFFLDWEVRESGEFGAEII